VYVKIAVTRFGLSHHYFQGSISGTGAASGSLMTNFFVYMVGVVLVVGALAYGASLLGLSSTWIAVIAIAAVGIGLMGAIVKTRQKEPS
jgi:hypothetical protein